MAKAAFPKPISFWNGLGAAQVQKELGRVRCVGGNCGTLGLWCSMLSTHSTFKWVKSCHSISSGAQYVTQDRYCPHPSLVIYFFATPPLKLKQQIGAGQLIANHLDQTLWSPLTTSQIIFITLFLAGAKRWCAFYHPMADWSIMLSQNRHIFAFLHPILLCRIAD